MCLPRAAICGICMLGRERWRLELSNRMATEEKEGGGGGGRDYDIGFYCRFIFMAVSATSKMEVKIHQTTLKATVLSVIIEKERKTANVCSTHLAIEAPSVISSLLLCLSAT